MPKELEFPDILYVQTTVSLNTKDIAVYQLVRVCRVKIKTEKILIDEVKLAKK